MTSFRVIGTGPQAAEPIEYEAVTAIEAELHCSNLRRICGRFGKVEVWKDGRVLSHARFDSLVRQEKEVTSQSDLKKA